MTDIFEIVNSAKEYYPTKINFGDQVIEIGIKHGISFSDYVKFVESVSDASIDENGDFDALLFDAAVAIETIHFYTDINPDIDVDNMMMFYTGSDLPLAIEESNHSYFEMCRRAEKTAIAKAKEDEEPYNKDINELCKRILDFLDSFGNYDDSEIVDIKDQKALLDNISNADWKAIVQNIVEVHHDEWDENSKAGESSE